MTWRRSPGLSNTSRTRSWTASISVTGRKHSAPPSRLHSVLPRVTSAPCRRPSSRLGWWLRRPPSTRQLKLPRMTLRSVPRCSDGCPGRAGCLASRPARPAPGGTGRHLEPGRGYRGGPGLGKPATRSRNRRHGLGSPGHAGADRAVPPAGAAELFSSTFRRRDYLEPGGMAVAKPRPGRDRPAAGRGTRLCPANWRRRLSSM